MYQHPGEQEPSKPRAGSLRRPLHIKRHHCIPAWLHWMNMLGVEDSFYNPGKNLLCHTFLVPEWSGLWGRSHSCSLKRCVLPGPACQDRPRLLQVLEVTARPLTADGPDTHTHTHITLQNCEIISTWWVQTEMNGNRVHTSSILLIVYYNFIYLITVESRLTLLCISKWWWMFCTVFCTVLQSEFKQKKTFTQCLTDEEMLQPNNTAPQQTHL